MKYTKRDIRLFRITNLIFACLSILAAFKWNSEIGGSLFALSLFFLFRPFHSDEREEFTKTNFPMKLRKCYLVDMQVKLNRYIYTYAFYGKSLFKKHKFILIFESTVPHLFWSDIQREMIKLEVFFDRIEKGKVEKINIGTIVCRNFTEQELSLYGKNPKDWRKTLETAINKQGILENQFSEFHNANNYSQIARAPQYARNLIDSL